MIRAARVLLPLTLLPLLLTACGDEEVVVGGREPLASTPDRAELHARARALGVAPDLVRVTEVPGFRLAQQSVGVYGADGFSSSYRSRKSGARIDLLVDRGTLTADNCARLPVGQDSGAPVTCEPDGSAWYRTAAGQHEYAVLEDGLVVRVGGDTATVARGVLRAAAGTVRPPTDAELAFLLPPPPPGAGAGTDTGTGGGGEPVERGDLPPAGDGAPNNDVGTTG